MSQVFSKDAQFNNTGAPAIAQAARTELARTNFLTPPFNNCKAVVTGWFAFAPQAAATDMDLILVRNPDSDNVDLLDVSLVFAAPGPNGMFIQAYATDSVPSGKDVQYALVAQQFGAGGASNQGGAFIAAELISG